MTHFVRVGSNGNTGPLKHLKNGISATAVLYSSNTRVYQDHEVTETISTEAEKFNHSKQERQWA